MTKIATALGKKTPQYALPRFLAQPLGLASELFAKIKGTTPIITRETIRSSNNRTYYQAEKVVQLLGLTYTSIDEVIAETAKAFVDERI